MSDLLTAAQMRAIEIAAIESGGVTGLELMERAGRGVIEAVFEEWPDLAAAPQRAVVLCGPGNNGGDGFVVARLLKEWGWTVRVYLYGDPGGLPPDARVNHQRWLALGAVTPLTAGLFDGEPIGQSAAIIVDALFGTGLSRAIDLPLVALAGVSEVGAGPRLVSVDIPSGLCADSGHVIAGKDGGQDGVALPSDLTVTFHRRKLGHVVSDGPFACRKSVVKNIGLSGGPDDPVTLIEGPTGAIGKAARDHKYRHGHALILSGGSGRTGAARLAARAGLRIGAGLVTLGVPGSAQMEVASQVGAIMLRRAGTPDDVAAVLEDQRLNAVCLGPGLGHTRAAALVEAVFQAKHQPGVVLDADALTAFSGDPGSLFSLCRESRCVLTPHAGEFTRLFPDIAAKLAAPAVRGPAYSRVDATRAAAKRAGCVVLFKGPDTVIAAPDGQCGINSAHGARSAPWLATAGSGDVLAGFVTGLLARGFAPMQAAETAAWLHVECALSFGPGLIAEDLPEELPKVFRALGL